MGGGGPRGCWVRLFKMSIICLNLLWALGKYRYRYTDKKENQIVLIYKEIQSGAVAKSYMTIGLLKLTEYLRISSYIRKPFLIYA
jgi:hypothetical protein